MIQSEGKTVFMTDPTGDYRWAFDSDDKTTACEAELHEPWQVSTENLSDFLVHHALNEVVYTAPHWRECTQLEISPLPVVLAPMEPVSLGDWHWPRTGTSTFMSEFPLAEVGPAMKPGSPEEDRPGYAEIRVAAKQKNIPSTWTT